MTNNLDKYIEYSEKFNNFIYKNYNFELVENKLSLVFDYTLESETAENIDFRHMVSYESDFIRARSSQEISQLENLIFSIGLVECINYYKTVCSKHFVIECGSLSKEQEEFWHKLFYNGLGEHIYLNGISEEFKDERLFEFKTNSSKKALSAVNMDLKGFLLPVGGGKDSVLTMEFLSGYKDEILPFVMSAPKASYDCIEVAGYKDYLQASRVFDKRLFELNDQGFLNGHVPFSAILAFISVLGAVLTGKKYIALSNEKSANEPTVHGQSFNHQYSKSYEFERDFFEYSRKYLVNEVYYFSFLRPLYELDIAKLFATYEKYLSVFKSCNRGKKENVWCADCSKCFFVYIILYPYVEKKVLLKIFGRDLLDDMSLELIFKDLIGLSEKKPFECVGTVSEIRYSLRLALEKERKNGNVPRLLDVYSSSFEAAPKIVSVEEEHNVPEHLLKLIYTNFDK